MRRALRALERLENEVNNEIGTDRAPTRPLGRARARRDKLEGLLTNAQRDREELESLAVKAGEAERAADSARKMEQAARRAFEARKLADIQRRIDLIEQAKRDVTASEERVQELAEAEQFSGSSEHQVIAADDRRSELHQTLKDAKSQADERRADVERLSAELREKEHAATELHRYKDAADADARAALEASLGKLSAATPPSGDEPTVEDPPADLFALESEVDSEAGELEKLQSADSDGPARAPLILAVLALVAAAGAAGAGVVVVALPFVLAAAVALAVALRSKSPGAPDEQRLKTLIARRDEANRLRRAHDEQVAGAQARLDERRETVERASTLRRAIEAEVDEVLAAAGLGDMDRDDAIDRFRAESQKRSAYSEANASVARLRGELAEVEGPSREVAKLDHEMEGVQARLVSLFEACGITDEDLDRAREIYDEKVLQLNRYDIAVQRRDSAREKLAGLTAEATAADLQTEATVLEGRGADPTSAGRGNVAELEERGDQLATEAVTAEGDARELAGQLGEAARNVSEPAEIEEQLAEVRERVLRLEEAREILRLACDTLAEAAEETYRDIAPRLNEAVGQGLAAVTGGRYNTVYIDPEFTVTVESPKAGRAVEVDVLSGGTQDQIHLIQRVELVRILAGKEPLPILLDDPMLESDPGRREALAEYFAGVGRNHQLILFAADPGTVQLFEDACEQCTVIDLGAAK